MKLNVKIVCSACLTEACAQGVLLCEDARHASFTLTHALHEQGCPICRTGDAITRNILESLCRRDGISLESGFVPGEPARNFELADRLGIPDAFKVSPSYPASAPPASAPPVPVSPPTGPQRTQDQAPRATTDDQPHTGTPLHPSTDSDPSSPPCHHTQDT